MYQLSFSLSEFLQKYWQKQPTVIRSGFKHFHDPISPEELAGLSMEHEVDSRFVSNLDNNWIAEHGPFSEDKFTSLTETNWSLIVQAANHWHSGAAQLIQPFKTMPHWLFDDLMISYSVDGGGVGPHIDQYDVFIIQGLGKRRWRVGAKDTGQYVETCRASALRQIESFDAVIDDILQPGDILYIPPGFPHDGYALQPSMSYSIGFRSPKEQELVSNFADYLLANDLGDTHIDTPELATQQNFAEITANDFTALTTALRSSLDNQTQLAEFIGCMLSQSRHQLNIIVPDLPWQANEIAEYLQSGNQFIRVAGLRALYLQGNLNTIYINGEIFHLSPQQMSLASILCNQETLSLEQLSDQLSDDELEQQIVLLFQTLVNKGYWYCEE
ncbi:cupin domain-containing protein [Vibrio sp. TH_r3]|uniref:ribosomal protein uL16 3-hydroxylase n=1 Tax=Vibrio sp. TH_r3 TaxID=3082084 RepID=UPI0029530650|nr:cupin domain-containing protein [Vibrio sp. TH_r3]MDV7103408.1 cupin domain-containing protein [Vibrio sp. TH_r3]